MRTIGSLLLIAALTACAPRSDAADATDKEDAMASCPVIESANWHAWVDPPRDGAEGVLRVVGRVDLPTPGYGFSWALGPTDRAMPPGQRIRLEFTPPDGIVPQVVTGMDLKIDAPTPFREYRTVIVACGDQTLHEFGPVTPLE